MRVEATEKFDHPPRPLAQRVGAILWPSFFAAGVATMVFFAFVDPESLHDGAAADVESFRMTAYGITFFFFWLIAALSSAVSAYLVRTSPVSPPDRND